MPSSFLSTASFHPGPGCIRRKVSWEPPTHSVSHVLVIPSYSPECGCHCSLVLSCRPSLSNSPCFCCHGILSQTLLWNFLPHIFCLALALPGNYAPPGPLQSVCRKPSSKESRKDIHLSRNIACFPFLHILSGSVTTTHSRRLQCLPTQNCPSPSYPSPDQPLPGLPVFPPPPPTVPTSSAKPPPSLLSYFHLVDRTLSAPPPSPHGLLRQGDPLN